MHIEFVTREGEPSPYTGSCMFQYMTKEEMELYMGFLSSNFKGVFDKKLLKKMVEERVV